MFRDSDLVHILRMGEKLIIVHIFLYLWRLPPTLHRGPFNLRLIWGFFEAPSYLAPTYVSASSVHNVIENCHYLNHLPTPMSLRNWSLVQKAILGFQFLAYFWNVGNNFVGISPIYKHTFTKPDTIPIPMLEMDIMICPRITNWST